MMNRSTVTPDHHLDDSQLLHLIDSDAEPAEMAAWRAHALACSACADRLAAVGAAADTSAAALRRVQLPPDFPTVHEAMARVRRERYGRSTASAATTRSAGRSPWLRAAVVAALLLPFMVAPPLRAWVVEQTRAVVERIGSTFGTGPSDAPGTDSGSATLFFAPSGPTLSVSIDYAQRGGELRVSRARGPEVGLSITGDATVQPVLSGGSLRIRNSEESRATYDLEVPDGISIIRLTVGGRTRTIDPPSSDVTIRIGVE